MLSLMIQQVKFMFERHPHSEPCNALKACNCVLEALARTRVPRTAIDLHKIGDHHVEWNCPAGCCCPKSGRTIRDQAKVARRSPAIRFRKAPEYGHRQVRRYPADA